MQTYISNKAKSISSSPTLALDAKYKQMKKDGIPVVGFGAGEPDFNTPDNIKEAAVKAIENNVTKYTPASGTVELKKAICKKFKDDHGLDYDIENIVVSNGGKHSLTNIFMAICEDGDEVIIPAPFWVSYPEMVKMAGGVPKFLNTTEESEFKFSPEELEAIITPKTRALVLNSPSNPTGMVYSEDALEKIAKIAVKHGIYVIMDEIYEKLVYEGTYKNIATFGEDIKNLTITVNGMAKAYAMTGWRIGFTASNREVAKAMSNIQSHATSNPNSIAQAASVEALLGDQTSVSLMREEYIKRRDYMVERINSIDKISCVKPNGAFYIFMNVKELLGIELYGKVFSKASELCDDILERALVAMVPSEGFGIDGYVRLSYATSMENIKEGLDRIEKYIKNLY